MDGRGDISNEEIAQKLLELACSENKQDWRVFMEIYKNHFEDKYEVNEKLYDAYIITSVLLRGEQ